MFPFIAEMTFRMFGQPVSGGEAVLWTMALVGLWLCFRMLSDHFDRARITRYVRASGGTVKNIAWDPLGPGWFGARGVRIYQVCYRTRHGKTVTANCKTSLFSGVYWTGGPVAVSESSSEAVSCLSCGSVIPEDADQCPKCGWSYEREDDQ